MKVRVKHAFFDKEADMIRRNPGDVLTVKKERAELLISMKVAELIEEKKGGDPTSPEKAQG